MLLDTAINSAAEIAWLIFSCRACFDELQRRNVLMWLLPDYICDGVYIMDVVVRLHTGTAKDMISNFISA